MPSTIAVGGRAETQGEEGGKVEEEREETFHRQKQRNGGGFGMDTHNTLYTALQWRPYTHECVYMCRTIRRKQRHRMACQTVVITATLIPIRILITGNLWAITIIHTYIHTCIL